MVPFRPLTSNELMSIAMPTHGAKNLMHLTFNMDSMIYSILIKLKRPNPIKIQYLSAKHTPNRYIRCSRVQMANSHVQEVDATRQVSSSSTESSNSLKLVNISASTSFTASLLHLSSGK